MLLYTIAIAEKLIAEPFLDSKTQYLSLSPSDMNPIWNGDVGIEKVQQTTLDSRLDRTFSFGSISMDQLPYLMSSGSAGGRGGQR